MRQIYYLGTVTFLAHIGVDNHKRNIEGSYTVLVLATNIENAREALRKHWDKNSNGATLIELRVSDTIIGH